MIFEKQEYQEKCIDNIVSILGRMDNFLEDDLSDLDISLKKHYAKNNYKITDFPIKTHNNIDVLMETGTGKTFCYLKTIFELNKNFKKSRFIIIVPRTSIRAGVKQNIEQTAEYFKSYKKSLNVIEIKDAKKDIGQIENQFLNADNTIQVLLLTNSSINKNTNNMNRRGERPLLYQGSTWENIARMSPVVIIDEPHMLTGDATTKALAKLDKSLVIRFGATYPTDKKKARNAFIKCSIRTRQHFGV